VPTLIILAVVALGIPVYRLLWKDQRVDQAT
jgi:hypothetical protein